MQVRQIMFLSQYDTTATTKDLLSMKIICTRCLFIVMLSGERGDWSEAGCVVAEIDEESGLVVCKCNHLTNFAVLVVSIVTKA